MTEKGRRKFIYSCHIRVFMSILTIQYRWSRGLFAYSMSFPPPVSPTLRTESLDFPSTDSTVISSFGFLNSVHIGFFWSAERGDSVSESFSTRLDRICHVSLELSVPENVLHSDPVVWRLAINGVVVDMFEVEPFYYGDLLVSKVLGAPILGPTYTVELTVQNEIAPGYGAHTLGYGGGYAHQLALTNCAAQPTGPHVPVLSSEIPGLPHLPSTANLPPDTLEAMNLDPTLVGSGTLGTSDLTRNRNGMPEMTVGLFVAAGAALLSGIIW